MIYGTVVGRIVKDAVLRFTPKGDAVLGFTVASDVGYGEKKHAVFTNCSMWGKRGEGVAPYVLKGAPVTVIGEMDQRKWETAEKSGTSLECKVSELILQGSKTGDKPAIPQAQGFREVPEATMDDFAQDDIPF
jgi:single-strand DNA-binding protein